MGGRGYTSATSRKVASGSHKQQQLDIILATNPMHDDYHVGIRELSDILTLEEARQKDIDDYEEIGVYPDFTENDLNMALSEGYVTVYSSHDIKNGTFVSPSYMMARDYAGNGNVNRARVKLTDVAWINVNEGMFAKTK